MEVVLKGPALKEEISGSTVIEEDAQVGKVSMAILSERSPMETSSRPSPSNPKESVTISQEEQLEHTKTEMGDVKEENERLKMILAQIVKDYQHLQKQYLDIIQQEQSKKALDETTDPNDVEEPEVLVSLSLGTSSSTGQKIREEIKKSENTEKDGEGLTLGLDCKFEGLRKTSPGEQESNLSSDNSFEEAKEEEAGEPWPPSKILKNLRNGDHNEVSEQPQMKKARVSVRARCDAPTMNDGCQWRKYGQKIAKGNPCPRAYYRCTIAPGCPVRKQVQRCAEDMSILITTYEGTHNHPLPISATAMASTTAAAASMLMSGSSTSAQGMAQANGSLQSSSSAAAAASLSATDTASLMNGLNFGLLAGAAASRPRQIPFGLPIPSISSTPSYPTITLDLTTPPSSATSQLSQFTKFPRYYSSTGFSLSSSDQSATAVPTSWSSSTTNGFLSYGPQAAAYNKSSSSIGSLSLSRPQSHHQDSAFYHSILHKAIINSSSAPPAPNQQHPLTDTIAKAIKSDPSFQSAIAAAITSYVGAQTAAGREGGGAAHHGLKLGEQHSSVPHFSAAATVNNGCATSYLNRSSSASSSHQPNLLFLQPSLTFPGSKSASTDHTSESIN